MSKACRIFRNESGKILSVEAAEGVKSNLFEEILERDPNQERALDTWLVSKTKTFKEEVIEPLRIERLNNIRQKIESLGLKKKSFTIKTEAGQTIEIKEEDIVSEIAVGTGELRTLVLKAKTGGTEIRLGRVRFKLEDNKVKIDSTLLSDLKQENGESIKGLGLGTKLYGEFINFALRNNLNVESSSNLSPESTGVWNKLVGENIAVKESNQKIFKVSRLPEIFDNNEEPNLGALLNYMDSKSKVENISLEDEIEIKLSMIGIDVLDSQELFLKLEKAFMPDMFFKPTQQSLLNSKLYNPSEITDILTDEKTLTKIKDFIFKLRGLETIIHNDLFVDEAFLVSNSNERTGIGKFKTKNPFLVEKDVIEKLGGIQDRAIFEEKMFAEELSSFLATPYLERINTPEDLFFNYKNFYQAPLLTEEEGQLTTKLDEIRTIIEPTIIVNESERIAKSIDFLINLDDKVWIDSPKVLEALLTKLEDDLINTRIDVVGFVDKAFNKPIEETKDFLKGIESYFIEATDQSLDKLIQAYRTFFEITSEGKTKPVILPENITKENIFFLESKEAAPVLFKKHGLVPIGYKAYKRVLKDFNIEAMYEKIYNITNKNVFSRLIPDKAFYPTAFTDNTLDLNKLKNIENKENIIADIRTYIANLKADLTEVEDLNSEEIERYILSYLFYNKSTNFKKYEFTPAKAEEAILFNKPINNQEYLKTDFISDFYFKSIKEKRKNSIAYSEFFSNFAITETGIEIISNDPIFKENSKKYLPDNKDLVNYFLLKKSLSKLGALESIDFIYNIEDDLFLRNYYSNYPHTAPVFKGNYSRINNNEISAETNKKFIRVSGQVYEIVKSGNNFSVYGKLTLNKEVFKSYIPTRTPPTLINNTSDLKNIPLSKDKTGVKTTPLYTEREKDSIRKDKDNCR